MKFMSCLAAGMLIASPVLASSEEAWETFRRDVTTSCTALVEAPEGADIAVETNPFGSASYGAALVTVTERGGAVEQMVCIYDKQSGASELTAPFPAGALAIPEHG